MKPIILDRDGVINQESPDFIKSLDEWQPIKGSLEAIGRLSQAGYDINVMTNQSAVGRGLISVDMLGQIHIRMINHVQQYGGKIQCVLFCPHHPNQGCECRKPKTGMYTELADRLNISLADVYSVGDSLRDLQAAQQAGARPVLVKTGNGRKTERELKHLNDPDFSGIPIFDNLGKFTDALLSGQL